LEKLSYLIAREFVLAFQDLGWPQCGVDEDREVEPLVKTAGA
jgi:hypothetical protein